MCLLIGSVFHVSDVAHGPRVHLLIDFFFIYMYFGKRQIFPGSFIWSDYREIKRLCSHSCIKIVTYANPDIHGFYSFSTSNLPYDTILYTVVLPVQMDEEAIP